MSDDLRARLDRYRRLLPPGEMARLEAALAQPRPPALRVNTLKIAVDQAARTWPAWYGWDVRDVPFCPAGWQILRQEQPIGQTWNEMGATMCTPPRCCPPSYSRRTTPADLDLAAAPGSAVYPPAATPTGA